VRHDDAGFPNHPVELGGFKKFGEFDVPGMERGTADLSKNISSAAQSGPFVDGANQAIEGLLGTDGREYHNTPPA
jgi:hypothetical protein